MSGARFNFGLWRQLDYNPYGTVFTERQNAIINGEPVDFLRKQEITTIMRKADKIGLSALALTVYEQYEDFLVGKFKYKYTFEEAKEILKSLTSWET